MKKLGRFVQRTPPAITLLLLAPVLGELVSAHQTPLEFINPLNFLVLSLPYGFGALLCREIIVRRKKGLLGLLLSGIAYAIYEEGIVVHSFFNPNWEELGSLARYGYYAGINWTWSELMVHFHIFISIGSSILIAEIIYPDKKGKSWLDTKELLICLAGFLAWIPLGFLMTDYFPPVSWYTVSWVIFILLVAGVLFLPNLPYPTTKRKKSNPWFFFFLGLVNMPVFFLTVFLTPDRAIPPLPATAVFLVLFDGISLLLIARWSGNGFNWDDRHRLALVAGLLSFFVYFCFAKDFEGFRGTSLTGIGTIIGIWGLIRAVMRRERGKQLQPNGEVL